MPRSRTASRIPVFSPWHVSVFRDPCISKETERLRKREELKLSSGTWMCCFSTWNRPDEAARAADADGVAKEILWIDEEDE